MASKSYVPAPSDLNPNPTTTEISASYPHWNSNAIGSEYATTYGKDQTIHLKRQVYERIYDAIPEQFSALRILMANETLYEKSDVFEYTERTIARPSLIVASGNAGGATVACTLQAGQGGFVSINDEIVLPDNSHAIVSVKSGDTITLKAQTGATLPAVSAADLLVVTGALTTDGVNFTSHFDKLQTITHVNYIGQGERGRRWTRLETQKYLNSSNTDFYQKDKAEQMELIYQDMFHAFWNGVKGEYDITAPATSGGVYKAKTGNGIYPMMVSAGSQHATSTPTTLVADFKTLAFNSNYKAPSSPRFIFGSAKMLNALSESFKNPTRYLVGDTKNAVELTMYEFGTMKFIPVVTALFEERSRLFPAFFENTLFVLDVNTINPVCIEGYEPIEVYSTKLDKKNGGRETYTDFTAMYTVSLKMNNMDGSFYITGQGF